MHATNACWTLQNPYLQEEGKIHLAGEITRATNNDNQNPGI